MPRRIRLLPKGLSVTAKFVITFLSILSLSMFVMGFILYVQASRSAIAQAQVVLEQNLQQMKSNVSQKVSMIENLSQIVAYDPRIRNFLGNAFLSETYELEEYRDNIAPILDNLMRQNTYIRSIRIYMRNESIPELYDGFYHMDRLNDIPRYADFIASKTAISAWQELHREQAVIVRPGTERTEQVFSYDRKIFSSQYTDMAGLLEIEVNRDVLFDVLKKDRDHDPGQVFAVDGTGRVVTEGLADYEGKTLQELGLPAIPPDRSTNEVVKVRGTSSIVISTPLSGPDLRIIGVFPVSQYDAKVKNSRKTIAIILLAALTWIGVIVYFITSALLSRMKVLYQAMKRVREGSLDVSVPVDSNDEFAQMALNFNHMTARIHELVETVYKSKLIEKEAELRVLESQINPHFLYNTLATISWVARSVKSPEITSLSNALAKFYRLVLNKGQSVILVRDELEMVRVYLQIQKFRFEDRFEAEFQIEDRVQSFQMVKNILQPLVENALSHGIEPKRSPGRILIKAGLLGDRLHFQVEDDGVGIPAERLADILEGKVEKSSGSGYAIKNIIQRLKSYYGDRHEFRIESRPGFGTVVTVIFPRE